MGNPQVSLTVIPSFEEFNIDINQAQIAHGLG
jgi:hypothetical protein